MKELEKQTTQDTYGSLLREALEEYDDGKKTDWERLDPQSELYDLPDHGYYLELLTKGTPRVIHYQDKYDERTNANGLKEAYKEQPHALTDFALLVIPQGSRGYTVLGMKKALNYALSDHPYKQPLYEQFGVIPAGTVRTIEDPSQGILFSGRLYYEDGIEARRGSHPMIFEYVPQLIPEGVDADRYQEKQMQLAEHYLSGYPSFVGQLLDEAVRR